MKHVLACLLLTLLMGFACFAAGQETEEPPFKAPVCRGTISAVSSSSLSVKTSGGDMSFDITATTKVIGAKKAVPELAAGDQVTVTFTQDGGKKVATHIRVAAK